ncbi:MAG: phosphatase family protein [Dehalococcoidia bacterium]|nr:phosphatase family protein [Dehalococcoidia bacterium]
MSRVKTVYLVIAFAMATLLSIGAAMRDYFVGDLFLTRALQEVRAAPWKETMEIASFIGSWLPMAAIASACFAWLAWRRRKAECLMVGGALLSFGLNPLLKMIVDRPRPAADLVVVWQNEDGLSFPSGHAFTAMVVFGLLYYLAPVLFPWRRAVLLVRISSPLLILLIGLSRVYLGAHWPSDVLGGFLVGGLVLALLIRLHRPQVSRREVPRTGQEP